MKPAIKNNQTDTKHRDHNQVKIEALNKNQNHLCAPFKKNERKYISKIQIFFHFLKYSISSTPSLIYLRVQ